MRKAFILIFFIASANVFGQKGGQAIVTTDIDNFWAAYDKIIITKDTIQQAKFLDELYLKKATEGLKSLVEVRNYSEKDFLDAIRNYPKFWESMRANMLSSKNLKPEIDGNIDLLKQVYPQLKPATVYFSVGAFRTNGTILNNRVLIGAEMAMANDRVDVSEFPESFSGLKKFVATNPTDNVTLLIAHEYIHTQQKEMVYNLLSICLYEGVAEFVSVKATGKPSTTPAIAYGKQNQDKVVAKFEKDMFLPDETNNWMWSSRENEFGMRDLGYYIGYSICERYYEMASDKKAAIKEMIELDYTNEKQVEDFVDKTKFFSNTLTQLNEKYELARPKVVSIEPFSNGSQSVDPNTTQITVHFSAPLNGHHTGFDYGPLGESTALRVKRVIGFSEDKKAFTFEVELKPGQHYQTLVTNTFRTTENIRLKPFLIDIKTSK